MFNLLKHCDMSSNDSKKKVSTIWSIVRTIIELIIGAIVGAGVESSTSVISNLFN